MIKPKCFISYCEQLLDLDSLDRFIDYLLNNFSNRIEIHYFRKDIHSGHELDEFMKKLDDDSLVVLVLTPDYANRVNGNKTETGVFKEFTKISQRFEDEAKTKFSSFFVMPILAKGSREDNNFIAYAHINSLYSYDLSDIFNNSDIDLTKIKSNFLSKFMKEFEEVIEKIAALLLVDSENNEVFDISNNTIEEMKKLYYQTEIGKTNKNFAIKNTWKYTTYNTLRVNCSIYSIEDDLFLFKDNKYLLKSNKAKAWEELVNVYISDNPPAGSWFLVKEQRNFLLENILQVMNKCGESKKITILEAGSASYVHHFTYLKIILDALNIYEKEMHVDLTVIDKVQYPLSQIKKINNFLLTDNYVGLSIFLDEQDWDKEDSSLQNIILDEGVQHFLIELAKHPKYNLISTSCVNQNLRGFNDELKLKFDIITEHFFVSCIEEVDPNPGKRLNKLEYIREVRCNYKSMLKNGGHLICAKGSTYKNESLETNNNKEENHLQFMEMHKLMGFVLADIQMSWDPYGFSKNELKELKSESEIPFDNYLINWELIK